MLILMLIPTSEGEREGLHLSSHTVLTQVLPGQPLIHPKEHANQQLLPRSSDAVCTHHNIVHYNMRSMYQPWKQAKRSTCKYCVLTTQCKLAQGIAGAYQDGTTEQTQRNSK